MNREQTQEIITLLQGIKWSDEDILDYGVFLLFNSIKPESDEHSDEVVKYMKQDATKFFQQWQEQRK